jgi:Fe-S-cluster-containing hydrogenase component 2
MGHLVGKDVFRQLGEKIDSLTLRAPWSETFRKILEELYSQDEAEVFVAMPYGFAPLARIARTTGREDVALRNTLERMADRGLVVDFLFDDDYQYMPSPIAIGLFEFSMMRTGPGVDSAKLGKLFHEYLSDGAFYAANTRDGAQVSIMRALPHEGAIEPNVEILDYEKASAILEAAKKFSIGICSCRHEKLHAGVRECDGPLEVCTAFDRAADFLIRHALAREASKGEMLENLARSREQGLVLTADNVQRNVGFICHCCSCCCNMLAGISRFGYANTIVTSSFIAHTDEAACQDCGNCAEACPIHAIQMVPVPGSVGEPERRVPKVDESLCIGCGVCGLDCAFDAMRLHKREQRVLHPETTFERVILQCLERGTLQNQIFDDPTRLTHAVMRAILGAFLRLSPAKKALMSEALRSRFLGAMKAGVRLQGKAETLEL